MDDGVRRLLRETEVAARLSLGAPSVRAARTAPAVRIAVRSVGRVVIVPVSAIMRLEACDNYVRIWADRPHLHKETLTGLVARLDPALFVRVHRSHAVNAAFVRELRPHLHGGYKITLADGAKVESGRSYRSQVRQAFGLP
jgi:two-component system LytT family response regulator